MNSLLIALGGTNIKTAHFEHAPHTVIVFFACSMSLYLLLGITFLRWAVSRASLRDRADLEEEIRELEKRLEPNA